MSNKPDNQDTRKDNSENHPTRPPWFPENYPIWLIADACLALQNLIGLGAVIHGITPEIQLGIIFTLMDITSYSEEEKMDFIKELILLTNPNLTDREIQVFIQGVVQVYAANHAQRLPHSDRFHEAYPHFKGLAADYDTQSE